MGHCCHNDTWTQEKDLGRVGGEREEIWGKSKGVVLAYPLQGRKRKEMSAGKPCRAALLRSAVEAFCPKTRTIAVNIDGDCCSTDFY